MKAEIERKLIKAAIEGMKNAFTGTNKPNDMSLAHAAAHGEYDIAAIAITGNESAGSGNDSIYPCHMCKQLLWESYLRSKQNTEIILTDEKGKVIERLKLLDIMNHMWPKG